MSEDFDPYRRWLGIAPHEQPPHHYRLLGIALFEDDPDVIEGAADRQMAHVRTFQAGKHGRLSQTILNELATAKGVLLNEQKKTAYDAQLQKDLAEAGAPSAPPPPEPGRPPAMPPASMPAPPPPARPSPPQRELPPAVYPNIPRGAAVNVVTAPLAPEVPHLPVVGKARGTTSRARARRKNNLIPLVLGLIGVGAVLVGVLVLVVNQMGTEPPPEQAKKAVGGTGTDAPVETRDSPRKSPPGSPGESLTPPPGLSSPKAPADAGQKPPPVAPQPPEASAAEKFRTAMDKARAALEHRQLAVARVELTNAKFATMTPDEAQAEEHQRLESLYKYLDEFWRGVRDGVYKKTQAGEVIPSDDGKDVELVKRAGEFVTYKLAGSAPQEAAIVELAPQVALAFAQRGLEDSPQALLSQATFLIFEQQDALRNERAKALWVKAAEQGVKDLAVAKELGLDAAFISSISSKPEGPAPQPPPPKVKLNDNGAPSETPRIVRQPQPTTEALRSAKMEFDKKYGSELAQARGKADVTELLLNRLVQEIEQEQNSTLKLVMIDQACDLAAVALRVDTMLSLLDLKAAQWEGVDALREKQLALNKFRPTTGPALESVTDAAESLAREAESQDRLDVAIACINLALRNGSRIKDRDQRDLTKRLRELEARQALAQRAALARTTLTTDPQNPAAHQSLGQFLCYYSNEWDEGLPHLARGELEEEAQLAKADLAKPTTAAAQAEIGERWYQLAKKKSGPPRIASLWRAKFWLDQALPNLTDDARLAAESRLRDIAQESAPASAS